MFMMKNHMQCVWNSPLSALFTPALTACSLAVIAFALKGAT